MVRYSFTASIEDKSRRVELHATGCRDLRNLRTLQLPLIADDFRHVVGPAHEAGIKLIALPCCAPARMRAAGRVIEVPDAEPEATLVTLDADAA